MSAPKPGRTGRRRGAIYIEPDSLAMVVPALFGALVVGGVSFLMSWDALRVVATWAGIAPGRTWGLPVAIDSSILVFTTFWLIARRRGEGVWFHVGAVAFFTVASMGGNVSHALADGAGHGWQIAVGAVAAAAFPLTVFASTHVVAGVLVDPDADVRPVRRRPARVAAVLPAPVATAAVPAPRTLAPASPRPVRSAPARATTAGTAGAREQAVRLAGEGMSQRQIAEAVGASKSSVARWLVAEAIPV